MSAATFVVPSDRDMVQRADAIVIANAAYSASRPNGDGGIETVTQMFVEEVIKGNPTGSLTVVEPGGTYGGASTAIPGVPQFVPGQRMLLFLRSTGRDRWSVADLILGKFSFVNDDAGKPLLLRDETEIVGWDPDLKQHVEVHRSAPLFLDFVRREARGGSGATDYVVPQAPVESTATQSRFRATTMIAPYTATSYSIIVSGSMGARWNVFPSPVSWFTGTTQEPGAPGGGVTAVQTGIASWNNDCPSNVNYAYAGTDNGTHTQGLHAADGANTVLFERDLSSYGIIPFVCTSNSYSGTLGIGGVTSATGTNSVSGETFATTIEGDVEMNKGIANCTILFSNGDFNTAVTHEIGHTLGFRHSDQTRSGNAACTTDSSLECSNTAVMKSFIPNGLNGALQAWDQHAVQALYPGGSCTTGSGDGKADLVWRNSSSGANTVWQMSGATRIGFFTLPTEPSPQWIAEATGDFNRDGSTDLVWRNYTTGQNTIWLMSGGVYQSTVFLPSEPDPNWHIEGAGDFNGDGNPDIVWRNYQSGANTIWLMSGTSRQSVVFLTSEPDVTWHIVGVGDFNGDRGADLVWRNFSTGANTLWIMAGTARSQFFFLPQEPDPNWHIVAAGDFDGDGHADLVWRNFSTGANTMWFMNGSTRVGFAVLTAEPSLSWRIETAGDFR